MNLTTPCRRTSRMRCGRCVGAWLVNRPVLRRSNRVEAHRAQTESDNEGEKSGDHGSYERLRLRLRAPSYTTPSRTEDWRDTGKERGICKAR